MVPRVDLPLDKDAWLQMLRLFCKRSLALLVLASLVVPVPVIAAGPDYAMPGHFALPWPCGQSHRITWGPVEHWLHGKATGIAFDFAMEEGTPLLAPAAGMAYFLKDERPFETNLGNYVEVATEGDWLVRLAHLRDPQSGERRVRAGELIGHSGSSGVPTPHLHLEVLMSNNTSWVRPNIRRMERFFGQPMADLVEGAIITNDSCATQLTMDGNVQPTQDPTPLGAPVYLVVPLRNEGLEPATLNTLQVSLCDPFGDHFLVKAQGEWLLDGKATCSVRVRAQPNLMGIWRVEQVTCETHSATFQLAANGSFAVAPSTIQLVDITLPPTLDVGDRIALQACIKNHGDRDLVLDDVQVAGLQPDGTPWCASIGHKVLTSAGSLHCLELLSATVPQKVGEWQLAKIGFRQNDQTFFFDQLYQTFALVGPQLVVNRLAAYASPKSLDVFVVVTNVGTYTACPDSIEAWGWRSDGEHCFTLARHDIGPLAPGQSALIQMDLPLEEPEGTWRLAEVGYWTHGQYYSMPLPGQHPLTVEPAFLSDALP